MKTAVAALVVWFGAAQTVSITDCRCGLLCAHASGHDRSGCTDDSMRPAPPPSDADC